MSLAHPIDIGVGLKRSSKTCDLPMSFGQHSIGLWKNLKLSLVQDRGAIQFGVEIGPERLQFAQLLVAEVLETLFKLAFNPSFSQPAEQAITSRNQGRDRQSCATKNS